MINGLEMFEYWFRMFYWIVGEAFGVRLDFLTMCIIGFQGKGFHLAFLNV